MSAASAAGPQENFDLKAPTDRSPFGGRPVHTGPRPGLVAEFGDSSQPILFFDRHGRPVLIDNEPLGRALYLAEEDEKLLRITGQPRAWPSGGSIAPDVTG